MAGETSRSFAVFLRAVQRFAAQAGGKDAAIDFVQAEPPDWQPSALGFDLIVTHFFLDCFPEPMLSQVVASLALTAKPNARWLVADFQIPPRGFDQVRARTVLALAYTFFRRVTNLPADRLVPPDAALVRNGFQLHRRATYDCGLLRSDVWKRA
ncbi:MAG: hypothetical protein EPO07_19440 [Verrucomicrobia bacterium]|nr:MAG: hypothetical protein EPO07_19440 [Verrucomicrobiota bacterium]